MPQNHLLDGFAASLILTAKSSVQNFRQSLQRLSICAIVNKIRKQKEKITAGKNIKMGKKDGLLISVWNFMKKFLDLTTLKFLAVGVVNTLVGTGLMFVLYNIFSVNYWVSSASNYIVGSIVSYFLNKYFTFQNKERSARQIVRFVINITLCYLVAYGLAKPAISFVLSGMSEKVQGNCSMLVGMCLFVALNYLGQRFFVFKKA